MYFAILLLVMLGLNGRHKYIHIHSATFTLILLFSTCEYGTCNTTVSGPHGGGVCRGSGELSRRLR